MFKKLWIFLSFGLLVAALAWGQSSTKDLRQQAAVQAGIIPARTIVAYGGSSVPAGWLLCNGQEISQTSYAALYTALGSTWNTAAKQDGTGGNYTTSGGNFRVPDLRGVFQRGVGTSSRIDGSGDVSVTLAEMKNDTTAPNSLSVTVTGNKNQFNTNQTTTAAIRTNATAFGTSAIAISSATGTPSNDTTLVSSAWTGTFTASGSPTGDIESGPRSVGVNYIIKY